jgi:hypothetical protein
MKLTVEEFRNYVKKEVEKISIQEGWSLTVTTPVSTEQKEEKTIVSENTTISFENSDNITAEAEKIEVAEVKMLAEEVKRMKDLVDFRSPLLVKD